MPVTESTPSPHRSRSSAATFLLAGPVLLFAVVFAVPLARLLWLSVWEGQLTAAHYLQVFQSERNLRALWWTLQLALGTSVLCLVIGYPVAYCMARAGPRLRAFILICIIVPFWTSALVRAFAWIGILGRSGLVNTMLLDIGVIDSPLTLVFNAGGVYVGTVHIMLPYMILSLYSAMVGIDRNLLRAAETLGASPTRAFLCTYVPLSMPGVVSGFLLVFIISLGFFVTPVVLGGPRDRPFVMLVELYMNELLNWPMASALAVVLLVVTLAIYFAFARSFGFEAAGEQGQGRSTGVATATRLCTGMDRSLRHVRRLRRARDPAAPRAFSLESGKLVTFVAVFVSILIALPIVLIVLLAFSTSYTVRIPPQSVSLQWFALYLSRTEWLDSTLTSFKIAVLTALLSCAIVVPTALGLKRLAARRRAVLLGVLLTPIIVPGIIYGVALYLSLAPLALVGTVAGLTLGHAMIAMPPSLLIILAAVYGFDERMSDAAASLGATPFRAFRLVTLPLIAPAVAAAALVAFLTSFDDVAVALFLTGGEVVTLPKRMYDSIRIENDPRVMAAAAVLVGISIIAVVAFHLARRQAELRRTRRATS